MRLQNPSLQYFIIVHQMPYVRLRAVWLYALCYRPNPSQLLLNSKHLRTVHWQTQPTFIFMLEYHLLSLLRRAFVRRVRGYEIPMWFTLLRCLSLCNTQVPAVNLIHAVLCAVEGVTQARGCLRHETDTGFERWNCAIYCLEFWAGFSDANRQHL